MSDLPKAGGVRRSLLLFAVLSVALLGSFKAARALRGHQSKGAPVAQGAPGAGDAQTSTQFPTGDYLVAYVLMSSECGFCTEKHTEEAIRTLRDSLRASQGSHFAHISVVGVSLDDDLAAGSRYLSGLGKYGTAFDQVAIGESWLNEFATRLIWRDGLAKAAIPQVVLIERRIDARNYPRYIDVRRDSMLLTVTGRDSLIAWVAGGTRLDFGQPKTAPR
jgi:hypothetical protein